MTERRAQRTTNPGAARENGFCIVREEDFCAARPAHPHVDPQPDTRDAFAMRTRRNTDRRPLSLRVAHRLLVVLAAVVLVSVTLLLAVYGFDGAPVLLLFAAAIVGTALLAIGRTS
jgi:hypothetical protein